MNLPTTTPNDRDLAWYVRECEWLDDRNRVLAAEVDQWAARCAAAIWMLPETVTGGQLREAQDKFHRERENLRRENAALKLQISALAAANDKLFMENLYLGKDKQRLDWLAVTDVWFDEPATESYTPETFRAEIDRKRKEAQP